MTPPLIAISAALEPASWSVWKQTAALVPANYIDALQSAGAVAVVVPPDHQISDEELKNVLERMDGLMLIGGVDLDPANYGEAPHSKTIDFIPERDMFETRLLRVAIEIDLPVLAICRGMQLLNVVCGGTLDQHLPETLGHSSHRPVLGSFDGSEHMVKIEPGSKLAEIVSAPLHEVKSHHHQGVSKVGDGLKVTARAVEDNLPEALELEESSFVLGVQWHPEADSQSPLIAALVEAASASKNLD